MIDWDEELMDHHAAVAHDGNWAEFRESINEILSSLGIEQKIYEDYFNKLERASLKYKYNIIQRSKSALTSHIISELKALSSAKSKKRIALVSRLSDDAILALVRAYPGANVIVEREGGMQNVVLSNDEVILRSMLEREKARLWREGRPLLMELQVYETELALHKVFTIDELRASFEHIAKNDPTFFESHVAEIYEHVKAAFGLVSEHHQSSKANLGNRSIREWRTARADWILMGTIISLFRPADARPMPTRERELVCEIVQACIFLALGAQGTVSLRRPKNLRRPAERRKSPSADGFHDHHFVLIERLYWQLSVLDECMTFINGPNSDLLFSGCDVTESERRGLKGEYFYRLRFWKVDIEARLQFGYYTWSRYVTVGKERTKQQVRRTPIGELTDAVTFPDISDPIASPENVRQLIDVAAPYGMLLQGIPSPWAAVRDNRWEPNLPMV